MNESGKRAPTNAKIHNPSKTLSRRRLVGILAAGGAGSMLLSVPDTWKRPVVESVLLPAHGQTTGPTDSPSAAPPDLSDGFFTVDSSIVLYRPDDSILDYFVGTANAGSTPRPIRGTFGCIELSGGLLVTDSVSLDLLEITCGIETPGVQGAELGGPAQSVNVIGVSSSAHDQECNDDLSPASIRFVSITGTAPNRVVRIELTTSQGAEFIDCPEGCN